MNIQFKRKIVPIELKVQCHAYEDNEAETTIQVQQFISTATPDEIALLSKLFQNDDKRKQAISLAKRFL